MIFLYSANGNIQKILPEQVYQGSDKATRIYFVASVPQTAGITVAFTLPNGYNTSRQVMGENYGQLQGFTDENGDTYAVWVYDLPLFVTAYSGTVTVQFYITIGGGTIATQSYNFTVNDGVAYVMEEDEPATYDDLLAAIGKKVCKKSKAGKLSVYSVDATGSEPIDGLINVGQENGGIPRYEKMQENGADAIGNLTIKVGAGKSGYDAVNYTQYSTVRDTVSGHTVSISDLQGRMTTAERDINNVESAVAGNTSDINTINGKIPSSASSSNKLVDKAQMDSAIQEYSLPLSTKYGAGIFLNVNTDYQITAQLKDQNGNALGSAATIDLPIESVVVSVEFDEETNSLIITLENGNQTTVPIGDIIGGLQAEITAQNPLESDLVTDTNQIHKFVTASDITAWNGHIANTSNPHSVTKAQVGLGNVDNTSDLNKPVSKATEIEINDKIYNVNNAIIVEIPIPTDNTAVSFSLSRLTGLSLIEWGDGTKDEITTETEKTHTYTTAGTYVVYLYDVTAISLDTTRIFSVRAKKIIIPPTFTTIQSYMFNDCAYLEEIILPETITRLSARAFYYCSSLSKIILYNKITHIEQDVLQDSAVSEIYYMGTKTEWDNISINATNSALTSATKYYLSDGASASITYPTSAEIKSILWG